MRFVETPIFTKEVLDLLDDDQYRALQLALIFRPEQGAIIPGSGGLRKLRWGGKGRGKTGRVASHLLSGERRGHFLHVVRLPEE
jgi:hypothetical protein